MSDERTIDGYVARLDDWRGPAVRELIELVRATAPEAKGSIKWAQPVFETNGPAIWVRAHPRTVAIGFWRGAEFDDRHGILLGDGDRMRHVTVRAGEAVPEEPIRDYIRQAIALNVEKGDPTRRASRATAMGDRDDR